MSLATTYFSATRYVPIDFYIRDKNVAKKEEFIFWHKIKRKCLFGYLFVNAILHNLIYFTSY